MGSLNKPVKVTIFTPPILVRRKGQAQMSVTNVAKSPVKLSLLDLELFACQGADTLSRVYKYLYQQMQKTAINDLNRDADLFHAQELVQAKRSELLGILSYTIAMHKVEVSLVQRELGQADPFAYADAAAGEEE